MPLGEIILIFVLAISAVAGIGAGTHKLEKRRKHKREINRLRELGESNARLVEAQVILMCWRCDQPIEDPTREVFNKDRWWHSRCYRHVLQGTESE